MKILHVITGLQKAAGTSVFCGEVCNQLAALGHDVTIAILNPSQPNLYPLDSRVNLISIQELLRGGFRGSGVQEFRSSGVQGFRSSEVQRFRGLGVQRFRGLGVDLHSPTPTLNSNYDLIHIHALWSPILHKVACWAHARSIPVVWSTHGMITPWAMKNKRLKKWLGWHLYQKRDLQSAALLHATAQSEVEDIRRMGLKNRVVVAPLGVFLPEGKEGLEGFRGSEVQKFRGSGVQKFRGSGVDLHSPTPTLGSNSQKRTLLFVSRVQRKKGLPMLLEAWAKLKENGKRKEGKDLTEGWKIRIVGPDEGGHVAELMAQCDRLGLSYSTPEEGQRSEVRGQTKEDNVHSSTSTSHFDSSRPEVEFAGPKFGPELDSEYASADLFVLPTHSENFGSVVIESLAQGVPVICTKGAPWEELETYHCGRWIDIGVEPLVAALSELLNLSTSELSRLGENGRKLVAEKYTWPAVAQSLQAAYEGERRE